MVYSLYSHVLDVHTNYFLLWYTLYSSCILSWNILEYSGTCATAISIQPSTFRFQPKKTRHYLAPAWPQYCQQNLYNFKPQHWKSVARPAHVPWPKAVGEKIISKVSLVHNLMCFAILFLTKLGKLSKKRKKDGIFHTRLAGWGPGGSSSRLKKS